MDNFIASSTALSTTLVTNVGVAFLAVMGVILILFVGVWAVNFAIKRARRTAK